MTVLGLLTNTLMGLVGAFPQLIIGMITDCISGSAHTLSTLTGTARTALSPLLALYAPMNRHALGLFCLILIGVMLVKGFLSFWTRWILIGVSREIEYDLRNDLLARLVELEPEFYVRNRTGDLMSRATNDLNAVRMVLGPGIMYSATTIVTMVRGGIFHGEALREPHAVGAAAGAGGGFRGALFRRDDSPAFGADSGRARALCPRARRRISRAFA